MRRLVVIAALAGVLVAGAVALGACGSDESYRVRAIFDHELQLMEHSLEPSDFIAWFERLRDEVLEALR